MHLPDGLLSTPVWVATDGLSLGTVGYALRRLSNRLDPLKAPVMGMLAAFVFVIQMINVPIPGLPKVSGHALGGVMTAVLLGPLEATVVMAAVFVVQALIFQDGGIAALGANVLNMGIAATLGAYACYLGLRRVSAKGGWQTLSLFLAGWLSVVLGAALAAAELWLSGSVPISVNALFGLMLGVHALVGLAEGVITVAAVRLVWAALPHLARLPEVIAAESPQ